MRIEVQFFARARDLAGTGRAEIEIPEGARVSALRSALSERFAALRPLVAKLHIAVDDDYADETAPLSPSSRVACFPPVSGG